MIVQSAKIRKGGLATRGGATRGGAARGGAARGLVERQPARAARVRQDLAALCSLFTSSRPEGAPIFGEASVSNLKNP